MKTIYHANRITETVKTSKGSAKFINGVATVDDEVAAHLLTISDLYTDTKPEPKKEVVTPQATTPEDAEPKVCVKFNKAIAHELRTSKGVIVFDEKGLSEPLPESVAVHAAKFAGYSIVGESTGDSDERAEREAQEKRLAEEEQKRKEEEEAAEQKAADDRAEREAVLNELTIAELLAKAEGKIEIPSGSKKADIVKLLADSNIE